MLELEARHATRSLGRKGMGIIAALTAAACQPGTLPCDKNEEWAAVCKGQDAGPPSGSGGNGSGGQNGGGGMGGNNAAALTAETPIANCTKYKTLGGMDAFFAMRCGAANTCHDGASATIWTDFKMPEVWNRLKDQPAKFSCKGDNIIDSKTWDKSAIWRKTRTGAAVACSGTGMGMSVMPPPAVPPMMAAITAEEDACLKGYLQAIAPP